jgi:hypothetical protein
MSNDPAKARFLIIQALRWAGAACIFIGLLVVNRRIDWPELAGYLLILNGLADVFVLPMVLARRWKSPPS